MTASKKRWSAFAGVLLANSLPHLAVAAAGQRHLRPLAGKRSSPAVNCVWGTANLVGGLAIARRHRGRTESEWAGRLQWLGVGMAGFAVWGVVGEALIGFNSPEE